VSPEEGELRPQLRDRFGLSVRIAGIQQPEKRVQIIKYRNAYDENPEAFCRQFAAQDSAVAQKLVDAREGLKNVQISDELLLKIAEISVALGIDGHRGDLTLMKAIRAYAALEGRSEAEEQDILKVAHMVFLHRMRSLPFEQAKSFDPSVIEKILHGEAAE
jgi:Mg-chelatase subunit ChlI